MATEINIKNLPTGYQSVITNGRHSILADEPLKSKGTDLGFSPQDLVLAGLAMCKVGTVRYIARRNGWDHLIRDVDGQLSQKVKRGKDGTLSVDVSVKIKIEGDLSDEQKKELVKEADACYIHRMIQSDWNIEHAIEWVEEETIAQ